MSEDGLNMRCCYHFHIESFFLSRPRAIVHPCAEAAQDVDMEEQPPLEVQQDHQPQPVEPDEHGGALREAAQGKRAKKRDMSPTTKRAHLNRTPSEQKEGIQRCRLCDCVKTSVSFYCNQDGRPIGTLCRICKKQRSDAVAGSLTYIVYLTNCLTFVRH